MIWSTAGPGPEMHLTTIGVVQHFCLLLKLAQTTGATFETITIRRFLWIYPALVKKTFFGPLHPSVSFLLRHSSKPVGWQPSSQCGAAPALSSPRGPWRAAVQPRNSVLYFPVRQTPLLSGVGPSAVTTSRRQATFDSASWTARCLSQRRLLLCGCNRVAQHGNRSSKRGNEGCACVGRVCGACGLGHRWVWWPPPCPHAWILFTVGAALLQAHSNPGPAGAHSSRSSDGGGSRSSDSGDSPHST